VTFQQWVKAAHDFLLSPGSSVPGAQGILHSHTNTVSDAASWSGIGCWIRVTPERLDETSVVRASYEAIDGNSGRFSASEDFGLDDEGVGRFVGHAKAFFAQALSQGHS